jgi:Na+/phosphate symporter
MFGSIVFNINLERYFYHHYNKESRSTDSALKELIEFVSGELQDSKTTLLQVFRTHIKFDELSTSEKIASNHLFFSVFETNLPSKFVQNITLTKTLLKRGFLKLEDFANPIESEKLSPQIEELLEQNLIELKKENNSICLCLSTHTSETSRLSKYSNMPNVQEKLQLNHFLNQAVVEKVAHKPIISVLETTTLSETRIPETLKERKKVFFG